MRLFRTGDHGLPLPKRHSELAAGYDLQAAHDAVIPPHSVGIVGTGFAWEIDPEPAERRGLIPTVNLGLIRDRSGMAVKGPCFVVAGVVDGDYRGEVKVALRNAGNDEFKVAKGDRIAQMILTVAYTWIPEEAETLPGTERGAGGFGSTGDR